MTPPPENIKPIIQHIRQFSSFLIISHENPDGDALGSQIAMSLGLRSLGKKTHMPCKDPVPKIYDFLPGQEGLIVSKKVRMEEDAVLFVLDCGNLERTGLEFIPNPPSIIINIDHHMSNTYFGHFNWVDLKASATSEMIFVLLHFLNIKMNPSIATNLYTGILTDTGSFQYSNTTARSLNIASQLLDAKADPQAISTAIYDRKTLSALKLMGFVLSHMEIYHQQKMAILTVTREILNRLNATYEDTEELVNLPQKIESIRTAVLIKELNDQEFKISFRSKGEIDVAQIAESLGGGGHPNAAGAKMNGDLSEIKRKIVAIFEEFLPLFKAD